MAEKTFKIGEVAQGGVITIKTTATKVIVIGKEWDFSTGSRRSSNQTNAKEFTRREFDIESISCENDIEEFLEILSTSYWAGKILNWIKTKISFETSLYW
jgi:hypothetical protein